MPPIWSKCALDLGSSADLILTEDALGRGGPLVHTDPASRLRGCDSPRDCHPAAAHAESLHSAGVPARCNIDWQALAAWVQAFGSIGAIWAAGRVVVRQQRLAREQVVEGVLAAIGVAHDLLTEAAETARDHELKNGLREFDSDRFTDALAWLTSATPHVVGDLRLVELLAEYPAMLRKAHVEVAHAVTLARASHRTPGGLWDQLQTFEQRSAALYAEAGRILTRAQQRTRQWLLR